MAINESPPGNAETLLAVDGQDICFHFGRKTESAILNNVNIAVNPGTIYSLLGPSGCGKTTLLKCIVGQLKPKTGSLKVYGRTPGSDGFFIPGRGVGYMPQDMALYMEMTTEEILTYFGSLYGMSAGNIRERITFLVELLELPDKKRLIQHLSGGQQRRVSFAIALIHKPPLLILDEPTVGVDPLLRKSIWNHLVCLAKYGLSTVIITTHYTEEARQAHIVGLMRDGCLLVQRNPEFLINICGGFTLEEVFLKVCQRRGNDNDANHEINIDEFISDSNISANSLPTNGATWSIGRTRESIGDTLKCVSTRDETIENSNNLRDNAIALLPYPPIPTEINNEFFHGASSSMRLYYLSRKSFLRLVRNFPLVIIIISLTVSEVVLVFLCVSLDPFDLEMAIVNEDTEQGSNKFGELFLNSVSDHTINKIAFENISSALESVRNGETYAALHIGSEFSQCLIDRILEGVDASNDTIDCSTIDLVLDMSNNVIAVTVYRSMLEGFQTFMKLVLESIGQNPRVGEMMLRVTKYAEDLKPSAFSEFLLPSVILCTPCISFIALTAIAILTERKYGLMSRTLVAGATTAEVLISFFFALLTLLLIQIVTIVVVTFYIFSATCYGHVFWIIVACTLSGICGMSFGLLLSAATDNESSACLIAAGTFFPLIFISGAYAPLEAMPYYLRQFCYCFPLTRMLGGIRSVMLRGWSITDSYEWDGYLISISWTIAQIMISIIVLKIRK